MPRHDPLEWRQKLDPQTAEWLELSRSAHTGATGGFGHGSVLLCVTLAAQGKVTNKIDESATVVWRLVSSCRRTRLLLGATFRDKRFRFLESEPNVQDGLLSNMELRTSEPHPEAKTLFPDSRSRQAKVVSGGVDELTTTVTSGGWSELRLICEGRRVRPDVDSGGRIATPNSMSDPASSEPASQTNSSNACLPVSQLIFLVYCTEWDSANGGLSTFNRELCTSLANLGKKVYLHMQQPGASVGASLREIWELVDNQGTWIPRSVNSALSTIAPDVVIGHDRITGSQALRDGEQFMPEAKRILFIHTDPNIEAYGDNSDSESGRKLARKLQEQDELMRKADCIVGVGPRLFEHVKARVAGFECRPKVIRLDPGFHLKDEVPPSDERAEFRLLMIARSNDVRLKGRRIAISAAEIAQALLESRTSLFPSTSKLYLGICGVSQEEIAELSRAVGHNGRISPYAVNRSAIAEEYRRAHLVLMPSYEEGFGLVALEAIEANRPVLATSNSGFAQLLQERYRAAPLRRYADAMIVKEPKSLTKDARSRAWAAQIVESIRSYRELLHGVDLIRQDLCKCTWIDSASQLVEGISDAVLVG